MTHKLEQSVASLYHTAIEFMAFSRDAQTHLLQGQDYPAQRLNELARKLPMKIARGLDSHHRIDSQTYLGEALVAAHEAAKYLHFCLPHSLVDEIRLTAGRELILRIITHLNRLMHALSNNLIIRTHSGSFAYAA